MRILHNCTSYSPEKEFNEFSIVFPHAFVLAAKFIQNASLMSHFRWQMKTHICSLLRENISKNENIMIMKTNCIDFPCVWKSLPQEIIKWLNNHVYCFEGKIVSWKQFLCCNLQSDEFSIYCQLPTKKNLFFSYKVSINMTSNFEGQNNEESYILFIISPYICFIDFMITHIFEHTQFEIYIKCLIIYIGGCFPGG